MRSPVTGIVTLILLFLIAIVAYSSIFTVQQTEQALVVRLGRPVDVVSQPGLNFKAPSSTPSSASTSASSTSKTRRRK